MATVRLPTRTVLTVWGTAEPKQSKRLLDRLLELLGGRLRLCGNIMPHPKQACVDCHFFVKEYREENTGRPLSFEIKQEDRDLCRRDDYSWHLDHYAVKCDFGVWSQGYNFDSRGRHRIIVEAERAGKCFFWPWQPAMLLPAARVLQEREAADKAASKDRRLTIVGLWIAAIALAADVILRLLAAFGLLDSPG